MNCPNCGYCESCGRSNSNNLNRQHYPYYPYVWPNTTWKVSDGTTLGGSNVSSDTPKTEGGNL